MTTSEQGNARTGRPPVTSAASLGAIGLDLFMTRGFEATTVDEIAARAGISRRTFFRYYPSKNDLVWGDFDAQLVRFRAHLATLDALPMMAALGEAVVEFNRVPPEHADHHRARMTLLLTVPALQAHSTLRYRAWRGVVAEFVAARTGTTPSSLTPRLVGYVALAACIAAYEQWLADPDADLTHLADLVRRAFAELPLGFTHHELTPTPAPAPTPTPAPKRRSGPGSAAE